MPGRTRRSYYKGDTQNVSCSEKVGVMLAWFWCNKHPRFLFILRSIYNGRPHHRRAHVASDSSGHPPTNRIGKFNPFCV